MAKGVRSDRRWLIRSALAAAFLPSSVNATIFRGDDPLRRRAGDGSTVQQRLASIRQSIRFAEEGPADWTGSDTVMWPGHGSDMGRTVAQWWNWPNFWYNWPNWPNWGNFWRNW